MKKLFHVKSLVLSLFLSSVFLLNKGHAALPPLPQSIKEIEAILSHDIFQTPELTGEVIWEIQKTERGYILKTTNFVIPIEIIQKPAENLGPVPFEISIDSLIAEKN